MRWSPLAVLDAVEAELSPLLVGDDQLYACRRIAAELQTSIASYYLECRLDEEPRVDFLVLTRDRLRAAQCLEGELGAARAAGGWRQNLSLLRGWAGEDPTLEGAPLAWLEYDVDERFDAEAPVASPSLCLEPGYFERFDRAPAVDQSAALRRALGVLRHVVPSARRESTAAIVMKCVAALPKGGSLVYVSEMLTRLPSTTKLYVALPKIAILQFLTAIGWPGDIGDVREILHTYYCGISETMFVDLSVTQGIIARIGFAFSQFHRREMRAFDPHWRWMPMPGASPHKRRALSCWPGQSEVRLQGPRSVLRRWVDIKVVLDENRRVAFKAYLGFMPTRRPLFT